MPHRFVRLFLCLKEIVMAKMIQSGPGSFDIRRDLYRAKLVFWLFVASLGMFFAAMILVYVLVLKGMRSADASVGFQELVLPAAFWFSTVCLVVISVALQKASWSVAAEDIDQMHRWIDIAASFSLVFSLLQYLGLYSLIELHLAHEDSSYRLSGICFALSLVHALHILGGMVYIGWIKVQGLRRRYDHERHWAVDNCAGYWHFLLVVWFGMLAAFLFC